MITMGENVNEADFLALLNNNGTLIIEDSVNTRLFKLIDSQRIYYKKVFKSTNQYYESILDLEDAIVLYNLFN